MYSFEGRHQPAGALWSDRRFLANDRRGAVLPRRGGQTRLFNIYLHMQMRFARPKLRPMRLRIDYKISWIEN